MEEGRHPIFDAAYKGNLDLVQTLTERDAQLVHTIDHCHWIPFLYAAFGGHMHVVRYLLERGTDRHYEDKGGRTALHIAATGGHVEIMELLLESGVSVNIANHKGVTPLIDAARFGKDALVLMLLEQRADVEAADEEGQTAMHHALKSNQLGMLKLLLELGANPWRRNGQGESVLDITTARYDSWRRTAPYIADIIDGKFTNIKICFDAAPHCCRILQGWDAA